MRHPRNKRERFLIGKHKGEKRAEGLMDPRRETKICDWFVKTSRILRSTTTACSCHMCRNPRHSIFNKGDNRLTMQERKFKYSE